MDGYLTEHSLLKAGDGWQVWEANLDSGSGQRERRRHSGPPPAVARVLGTVEPNQLEACPPGPARTRTTSVPGHPSPGA